MTAQITQISTLIVDDDQVLLSILERKLQGLGIHQIHQCRDGSSAIETITQQHVDILILDLNMPVMDGIEVMRYLSEKTFNGSIILLSSEDSRILKTAQNLATAYKLNVVGALNKPVDIDQLLPLLNQAMALQPAAQQIQSDHQLTDQQLIDAINDNAVIPYIQPKTSIHNGNIVSVEILARLYHEEYGVMPAKDFIPQAERLGLINDISLQVFEKGLAMLQQWQQHHQFTMGVNLSVDSLKNLDLPEKLAALLKKYDVAPESIEIEITESKLIENLTLCLDILTRLRLKGFGLSIDDFGTGYSSMEQLCNIPFTELKIDRAFVHRSKHNKAAKAVLYSSASLGKELGMSIVAEGIETEEDLAEAANAGCDIAQGYLIAKPMSQVDFEQWLTTSEKAKA